MKSLALAPPCFQQVPLERRDRTAIYHGVARLLWAQYCLENDIARTPWERAPEDFRAAILGGCEAFTNQVLDPDRRDAALMAMANAICSSTLVGVQDIREVSNKSAMQYLATAEIALTTFMQNLLDQPPSLSYRNEMCRLIDALAPKQTN